MDNKYSGNHENCTLFGKFAHLLQIENWLRLLSHIIKQERCPQPSEMEIGLYAVSRLSILIGFAFSICIVRRTKIALQFATEQHERQNRI